ncbi:hypothetical protein MG290_07325 [Flavobacterium sp. CBA20B-1]|uniref:hypothetical protein n=1 Tax=unclassified Flavobacterium TaxID=196869 RepID=UPI002224B4A0|nr:MULTISPECIES: hypothetical protein [unclassified Flavobacterium]WCM43462.1 hypothetical protein MG290_07325 [Flavobacterium sp. CBA20B-1]
MKRKLRIFIIFIISIFGVLIYLNSNKFIKNQEWKYQRGFNVGDYLVDFRDDSSFLCFGIILIVKNHEDSELGYYYNKKVSF